MKLKPLHEQVMVITGASSGIGLATAKMAAKKGAIVVLAARNREALMDIERQIRKEGGEAVAIVTDVGRREDLQRLAEETVNRFGRFDTWVNNAGVSIYGRLEEVELRDYRRLFEINFWGVVDGSLIAVQHLKKHGGTLINIGSVASDMAIPLQGMYSATKHAVKGFTDALRMELERDDAPVSVTLIKPTSINTPFPQHAKNYLDEEPKLPSPIYPPEEVARAICHAAHHPTRDIYVGAASKVMSAAQKMAPRMTDKMTEKVMTDQQKSDEPSLHSEGTLIRPGFGGQMYGDTHGTPVMNRSLYTRASMHPLLTGAIVAALGTGLVSSLTKRRGEKTKE